MTWWCEFRRKDGWEGETARVGGRQAVDAEVEGRQAGTALVTFRLRLFGGQVFGEDRGGHRKSDEAGVVMLMESRGGWWKRVEG